METILSFDVDRTLVDRSESAHGIRNTIKEALHDAQKSALVGVVLNTGRDLTALGEFDAQLELELDALFLSGRGERINGQVNANREAVLPIDLIEAAVGVALTNDLPFLDIKTAQGVMQLVFGEGEIAFGMQKPKDWYQVATPRVLDGKEADTLGLLEALMPIRLEIPCRRSLMEKLHNELGTNRGYSLEILPVHEDYSDLDLGHWAYLQVLSPIASHNKGTVLKRYVEKNFPEAFVVHFGDSDSHHNSDTVVNKVLPESRHVHVDWKSDKKHQIEETIVGEIRKYL